MSVCLPLSPVPVRVGRGLCVIPCNNNNCQYRLTFRAIIAIRMPIEGLRLLRPFEPVSGDPAFRSVAAARDDAGKHRVKRENSIWRGKRNLQKGARHGPGRPSGSSVGRIERLIPYADNARVHSEADIDKLTHSLRRWGCTNLVRAPRDQASGPSFDEHAARHNHTPGGTGYGETTFCRQ